MSLIIKLIILFRASDSYRIFLGVKLCEPNFGVFFSSSDVDFTKFSTALRASFILLKKALNFSLSNILITSAQRVRQLKQNRLHLF